MAIDDRELTDADLVVAAQSGDEAAFETLFRRHYPTVRRVCARRMGSIDEGDEIAQAAFVRAYERIDQCQGERRFGAWVQVIAFRLAADSYRQTRTIPSEQPIGDREALGPNHCEDALLRAEQAAEIRTVLQSLPPRQRAVLVARDIEGHRPGEIAASLGLSLGAVDSLLLRARRRMAVAWQTGRAEGGAASLHVTSVSGAATAVAAGRHTVFGRAIDRVGRVVERVSLRVATGLGVVPGSTMGYRGMGVTAAAMAGAIAVAPHPFAVHPVPVAHRTAVASHPAPTGPAPTRTRTRPARIAGPPAIPFGLATPAGVDHLRLPANPVTVTLPAVPSTIPPPRPVRALIHEVTGQVTSTASGVDRTVNQVVTGLSQTLTQVLTPTR